MSELMVIDGIECYEFMGTAYLKTETVARGLGFTTTAASGNEVVRWNTVYKHLSSLGAINTCNGVATSCNGSDYRSACPEYIPENVFYRLAMKAKNEAAETFQAKIADEIIPALRKTGEYRLDESSRFDGKRGLTTDDYLRAASIVANCRNERMPYVLGFLEQGGFIIPDVAPPDKRTEKEILGQEVIELLNTCGLGISEICKATGIGRTQMSRYKHGRMVPAPERSKYILRTIKAATLDSDGEET